MVGPSPSPGGGEHLKGVKREERASGKLKLGVLMSSLNQSSVKPKTPGHLKKRNDQKKQEKASILHCKPSRSRKGSREYRARWAISTVRALGKKKLGIQSFG